LIFCNIWGKDQRNGSKCIATYTIKIIGNKVETHIVIAIHFGGEQDIGDAIQLDVNFSLPAGLDGICTQSKFNPSTQNGG